ncbi:hypothetical protein N7492_006121 [Penicillium capsulatum]|uniref:Lysine-specific metallo-endopeptidase domain-containing protein n=1 Tax=Penicillium capsulatum TaxID=69766 RepID=A0A9W9I0V1_9EURO|nr:hypothetical protein N7492_006121 [Penicillium capsulatum]KAJ6108771.1 hypothetical protein N7512_008608 [Penicillium capsulatum]
MNNLLISSTPTRLFNPLTPRDLPSFELKSKVLQEKYKRGFADAVTVLRTILKDPSTKFRETTWLSFLKSYFYFDCGDEAKVSDAVWDIFSNMLSHHALANPDDNSDVGKNLAPAIGKYTLTKDDNEDLCEGKEKAFAYVEPFKKHIYLCTLWLRNELEWLSDLKCDEVKKGSMENLYTKVSTIIHEMTHMPEISAEILKQFPACIDYAKEDPTWSGGTLDPFYGYEQVRAKAKDPKDGPLAICNAASYEWFAIDLYLTLKCGTFFD